MLSVSLVLYAEPPTQGTNDTKVGKKSSDEDPVTIEVARDRAKLMHQVYSATLDVMHHHYFRAERSVLPARAMEDVFAQVAKESKVKARWIAVNTPAMSIQHEPESEFEKKAAEELAGGKPDFERIEKGMYQRASVIPLGASCVGCHTKLFTTPFKTPRFAGLVIGIPVRED